MQRVHRVQNSNTNGRLGLCLCVADLFMSKAFAGREKDREFCTALLAHAYVKVSEVLGLVANMPIEDAAKRRLRATTRRWAKTSPGADPGIGSA